ncbi:ATP dependent DNA ligase domain-containing protein [Trichoderma breve]|uniref:ATP dependent DNA ligase domain-containing protein n=1 Tax=Trichoderma breve TaxID=2034170 RepID=A0A9W9EC33_9HYPO|nr:ATP dependent DNA ligase domain-containing protein [Trichoderma breve]KAJ4863964.1 ATP dependent DNA ligase domain-containing protein [Trichoderma breve]
MPFPFSHVCDLLEASYVLAKARKSSTSALIAWCSQHRNLIDAPDTNLAALLSTLLPEKRTDRVYCIQANSLERVIGRGLMLGSSRLKELSVYKQPGLGLDLADCVERILTVTPNPTLPERLQVTAEEIDEALHSIAAQVRWSSPSIRVSEATIAKPPARSGLEAVYRRLTAKEAKWFTRLVLKDFQPLVFDAYEVYRLCDPLLPSILKIREDFTIAIETMQRLRRETRSLYPDKSCIERERLSSIKPQLSVKGGVMSVEAKVDGEYCQIHVDVSKGRRGIQIFSKSGKDSTEDRERLIGIIIGSLGIGKAGCNIKTECILEGELAVFSESQKKILPFHHIRKHVARRGRFMNTGQDSPPRPHEHLMIVYYDILLLDGQSLLNVRHSERFKLLEKLVRCDKGQAELIQRQIINTSHPMAVSALRNAFAKVITERGEGLVLKSDQPYFNFSSDGTPFTNHCIKLKKDYIGRFGEVGDFAVVGAGFNAAKARSYNIENLKWTHFYVGCIDNREEVKRWNARPEFTVVNVVELNEAMLKSFSSFTNPKPVPVGENVETKLKAAAGAQPTPMTVAFTNPPVFDMRCFSFDKAGDTNWWSLRFPSVAKIHFDRDFSDVLSFTELQEIAERATSAHELEDSQDNLSWIAKLEQADPRGVAVDAATQLTATTMPTPSPRRASHNSSGSLPLARHVTGSSLERSLELLGAPVSESHRLAASQPSPTTHLSKTTPNLDHKRKRITFASALFSPPKKRRQSSRDDEPESTVPDRKPVSESPIRRPLGEIDGNSTQKPQKSEFPLTVCQSDNEDLNASPHFKQPQAKETDTGRQEHTAMQSAELSSSHLPLNDSAIVIPDSDDEDETDSDDATQPLTPVRSSHEQHSCDVGQERRPSEQSPGQTKTICQYAGLECQLVNRLVLLPSYFRKIDGVEPLFREHGLSNIIRDAETWIRDDTIDSSQPLDSQTGRNKILFVDTVEKEQETKALLSKLEDIRENIPEERREWISVFDWRVLNHLAIYEDAETTKKYYDGFHDPWRRWYSGLV